MKRIFGVLIVALTACTSTMLLPPENVYYTISDNMFSLNWDRVVEADGYFVHVNPVGHLFYTTVSQWTTSIDNYPSGEYQLSVSTVYQDRISYPSNPIVVIIEKNLPK